jgi:hypothetical protein
MYCRVSGNRNPVSTVRILSCGSTCTAMWRRTALSVPNEEVTTALGRKVSAAQ